VGRFFELFDGTSYDLAKGGAESRIALLGKLREIDVMYTLLRPLLFSLEPARAHGVAMASLAPMEHIAALRALMTGALRVSDPRLSVSTMGLQFPSPVGLAGGLDKNAERARALAALGFGFLELGTVTAVAQEPNPAPNVFRLPRDRALINRLGFPNDGAAAVAKRLAGRRSKLRIPVAVSIGKSRHVPIEPLAGVIDDYLTSLRAVRDVVDFVVVNVSSPNTKNLRSMQAASFARPLFDSLVAAANEPTEHRSTPLPLLVKIAPDLDDTDIDALVGEAKAAGLQGVVATNTTVARAGLLTPEEDVNAMGAGGLSGKPLYARALSVVKRVRDKLGPEATVIGVGGIDSAEAALAMLRVGADLVQIYTGLVYEGPTLPRQIQRGLLAQMEAEGAASMADLVGRARHAYS